MGVPNASSLIAVSVRASPYLEQGPKTYRVTPRQRPTDFLAAAEGLLLGGTFLLGRSPINDCLKWDASSSCLSVSRCVRTGGRWLGEKTSGQKYGAVPVSSKRKSAREELGTSRVA